MKNMQTSSSGVGMEFVRDSGGSYRVLAFVRQMGDGGFNFGDNILVRDLVGSWCKFRALFQKRMFCRRSYMEPDYLPTRTSQKKKGKLSRI